jgi:hypothetical protein
MTKSFDIWNYKPWWCQPWSILLTGIVIITSSWLIGKNLWISLLVSLPIVAWWVYFLILYPRLVSQAMEESHTKST